MALTSRGLLQAAKKIQPKNPLFDVKANRAAIKRLLREGYTVEEIADLVRKEGHVCEVADIAHIAEKLKRVTSVKAAAPSPQATPAPAVTPRLTAGATK